ncbi:MAG: hypothetical protein JXR76_06965 [Deltaproteobacteria bacterium]|nr:hypothetical protein [Deltaproteobacteria bacterium]
MTPFFSQEANATATTVSADGSIVWDAYSTLDKSGTIYTYPDSKGIFADQLEKPVKQFIINNGIVYWDQIFSDHTEIFARPADFSKNTERVVYSDYVIDRFAVIGDCLFLGGTYDLIRHCSLTDPGAVVYRAPEELHLLNNFSNDDYVYFRSINEGILRVSAESSAQPELVTSYIDRDVIVADDGTLYYIDGDSGGAPACTTNWGLYKTEPSSPEVRIPLILPPMACPGSLIVDADALYWVNYDDSTLMKLAR